MNDAHGSVLGGQGIEKLAAAVVRAVVDEHDLATGPGPLDGRQHALAEQPQHADFVVNRQDGADEQGVDVRAIFDHLAFPLGSPPAPRGAKPGILTTVGHRPT